MQLNWASERTKSSVKASRKGRDNNETSAKRKIASGEFFEAKASREVGKLRVASLEFTREVASREFFGAKASRELGVNNY